ncbi:MAG: hypothetical protein ABI461_10295, partial [Polyangiaceae bacterium]
MHYASFFVFSVALLGCSARVASDSNSTTDVGNASNTSVPAATGTGAPIPSAVVEATLASCTAAEGPVHAWSGEADVAHLLQGRWLQCPSDTVIMGTLPGGQTQTPIVGIEFDGGQFYALGLDANGNAVREQGFGQTGNVHYNETPPYTYLYMNTNTANLFQPSFEDSPRKMLAIVPEI